MTWSFQTLFGRCILLSMVVTLAWAPFLVLWGDTCSSSLPTPDQRDNNLADLQNYLTAIQLIVPSQWRKIQNLSLTSLGEQSRQVLSQFMDQKLVSKALTNLQTRLKDSQFKTVLEENPSAGLDAVNQIREDIKTFLEVSLQTQSQQETFSSAAFKQAFIAIGESFISRSARFLTSCDPHNDPNYSTRPEIDLNRAFVVNGLDAYDRADPTLSQEIAQEEPDETRRSALLNRKINLLEYELWMEDPDHSTDGFMQDFTFQEIYPLFLKKMGSELATQSQPEDERLSMILQGMKQMVGILQSEFDRIFTKKESYYRAEYVTPFSLMGSITMTAKQKIDTYINIHASLIEIGRVTDPPTPGTCPWALINATTGESFDQCLDRLEKEGGLDFGKIITNMMKEISALLDSEE